VVTHLALGTRITICGAISQYIGTTRAKGPASHLSLLVNRATMKGLVVSDYYQRADEAMRDLVGRLIAGKLKTCQDVVDGGTLSRRSFKNCSRENNGKLALKVTGA
jgi:NADPH-dependent curcumin reductase